RRLNGEVGIEPSAALAKLEDEILLQKEVRSSAPGVEKATPGSPPTITVGAVPRAGNLPEGTVSFLLTDIEGSAALWEADTPAMSVCLARHERLIAETVTNHRGALIKSRGEGDSTL